MPTAAYAKQVVSAVLARSPRALLWKGQLAFVTWFVDTFLPRTFFVS